MFQLWLITLLVIAIITYAIMIRKTVYILHDGHDRVLVWHLSHKELLEYMDKFEILIHKKPIRAKDLLTERPYKEAIYNVLFFFFFLDKIKGENE